MNKIAITGDIKGLTRKEVISLIKEKGFEYTTTISVDTDVLIVGDKPSSKINKAKYVKAELINQEEFKRMFLGGFLA